MIYKLTIQEETASKSFGTLCGFRHLWNVLAWLLRGLGESTLLKHVLQSS